MLCNHSCSVSKLAASLSFFPPSPASYTVTKMADGTCQLQFTNQEVQRALQQMPPSKVQAHVHQLMTKRKETIVLFHFTWPGAQTTLLWSHGNAMDVGEMYFFFLQLAEKLKVNIAVYDYSGYGGSSGEPSEANLYADILAVHDFLEGAGVEPERHLDYVYVNARNRGWRQNWAGEWVRLRRLVCEIAQGGHRQDAER